MYSLDFDLLPRIIRHPVWRGLHHSIDDKLSKLQLPETYDRLRTASMLFSDVTESKQPWLSKGYLRAALSEFRSVPQALRWDIGGQKFYSPKESKNPLVHLVLRLRRLTVYVASVSTAEERVIGNFAFGDREYTEETSIVILTDIHRYVGLDKLIGYEPSDVKAICDWFDENQRVFGAEHVLNIGLMQYCEELCEHYKARVVQI